MARPNPLAFLFLCGAAALGGGAVAAVPEHLRVQGQRIETTHRLAYSVTADPSLRPLQAKHRETAFNGHPYQVSLAGFANTDQAVLVHAERVTDGSGASDYSNLPTAAWPSADFRTRGFCTDVPADEVAGEHDLAWLRDNGFDPAGTIAMEQALVTTADHNDEIVVSLIVKNVDCGNKSAVAAALDAVRAKVVVKAG